MPDFKMCLNEGCLLKQSCYRYRAMPDKNQESAYHYPDDNGECDKFLKIRPGKKLTEN